MIAYASQDRESSPSARRNQPTGQSTERRNSAAANSGEDEDFARIANRFEDATGAHIAVDGDSDRRLDIAILDDVFAQAGILAFEVVDNLADIPAGDDDPVFAPGVFTG